MYYAAKETSAAAPAAAVRGRSGGDGVQTRRAVRLLLLAALLLCGLAGFHFTGSLPEGTAATAGAHAHTDVADAPQTHLETTSAGTPGIFGGSERPAEEDCLAFATMAVQQAGLWADPSTVREMTVTDALAPPPGVSAGASATFASVGLRLADLSVFRT